MAKRNKIVFFFLIFYGLTCYAYGFLREKKIINGDVIEKIEFGEINWSTGVLKVYAVQKLPPVVKDSFHYNSIAVKSKAEARLTAFRKAKELCKKNLVNAVYNLRIEGNYFIKNYLLTATNEFKFKLNSYIDNIKTYKKIYNTDNSITVTCSIKLWGKGSLLSAVINKDIIPENPKINISMRSNIEPQIFSGLMIDARHIKNFYPSLNPEIYDRHNNLIYSVSIMYTDAYKFNGPAKFIGDTSKIENIKFLNSNVLTIRAVKKKNNTSLVISDDAVNELLASPRTFENLKQGKVVILIGK